MLGLRAVKDDLMQRIAGGEVEACAQLYQQHAQGVLNLCFRLVRDRNDAYDLTQEVFVRAFTHAGSFRHDARPLTWLYRIATNLCLNHLRRKKHRDGNALSQEADAEAVVADARERPDVELERNETRALVWQALERLPPPQRAVLVLQKYEELSCEEIATVMNCSVGAVQARLHRAKENLAKILIPLLREK